MADPTLFQAPPVDAAVPPFDLRKLRHYRPDYPYQPDLFYYGEFSTSDPAYVVEDVRLMSSGQHSDILKGLQSALVLLAGGPEFACAYREVDIYDIPREIFGSERHAEGRLIPDLTLWSDPDPLGGASYLRYDPDLRPQLAVEVVSHGSPDYAVHDKERKAAYYARMGITEYWVVDWLDVELPLRILCLPDAPRPGVDIQRVYRPQPRLERPDGPPALRSLALPNVMLRWDETVESVSGRLQVFERETDNWRPLAELPEAVRHAEGRAEGRREGIRQNQMDNMRVILNNVLPESQLTSLIEAWRRSARPLPGTEEALVVMRQPHEWRRLWPVDVPVPREGDVDRTSRSPGG